MKIWKYVNFNWFSCQSDLLSLESQCWLFKHNTFFDFSYWLGSVSHGMIKVVIHKHTYSCR